LRRQPRADLVRGGLPARLASGSRLLRGRVQEGGEPDSATRDRRASDPLQSSAVRGEPHPSQAGGAPVRRRDAPEARAGQRNPNRIGYNPPMLPLTVVILAAG